MVGVHVCVCVCGGCMCVHVCMHVCGWNELEVFTTLICQHISLFSTYQFIQYYDDV